MAAEHTENCPSCSAPRTCKANRGTRLVCSSCGEPFLAAGAGGAPPAPAAAAPSSSPGGVTVSRGTPVIAQTARPRPRAGELERQAQPEPAAESELEPEPEPPAPTVHQQAGRRGGLARYAAERLGR